MVTPRKYDGKNKSARETSAVTRKEIESKLEELDEIVQDATNSGKDAAKLVIGVAVVAVVAIAFFAGRRRALRSKTIVSFFKA